MWVSQWVGRQGQTMWDSCLMIKLKFWLPYLKASLQYAILKACSQAQLETLKMDFQDKKVNKNSFIEECEVVNNLKDNGPWSGEDVLLGHCTSVFQTSCAYIPVGLGEDEGGGRVRSSLHTSQVLWCLVMSLDLHRTPIFKWHSCHVMPCKVVWPLFCQKYLLIHLENVLLVIIKVIHQPVCWKWNKQDHQWWRYHRRLLDYQSPYFQLIIE